MLCIPLKWVSSKPNQNAAVLKHGVWPITSGSKTLLGSSVLPVKMDTVCCVQQIQYLTHFFRVNVSLCQIKVYSHSIMHIFDTSLKLGL